MYILGFQKVASVTSQPRYQTDPCAFGIQSSRIRTVAQHVEHVRSYARLLADLDCEDETRCLEILCRPKQTWTFDEVMLLRTGSALGSAGNGIPWPERIHVEERAAILESVLTGPEPWRSTRAPDGLTALHCIAEGLCEICRECRFAEGYSSKTHLRSPEWDKWLALLSQAVQNGGSLHAEYTVWPGMGMTPFRFLSWNSHARYTYGELGSDLLEAWIETLDEAGVNMETYFDAEQRHLRHIWEDYYPHLDVGRLSRGNRPSHWGVWHEHPGDEYAGIFWNMLEHPERAIPGAWDHDQQALQIKTGATKLASVNRIRRVTSRRQKYEDERVLNLCDI
jgi:hypothetical protein